MTNQNTTPAVDPIEQGKIVTLFEKIKQAYLQHVRLYIAMNIPAEVLHEILTELGTLFEAAKLHFHNAVSADLLEHYLTQFITYKEPAAFTNHFAMGNYHSVKHSTL